MAKKKIDSYIFNPGMSLLDNTYPNAYNLIKNNTAFIQEEASAWIANKVIVDTSTNIFPIAVSLLENNLNFIKKETIAYITSQVQSATPGSLYDGYTYDSYKCERDVEYNIVAITKDLKYGGNERSRYVQSLYWNDNIPQIDGDRAVEIDVYVWMEDLLSNYIFTNTPYVSLQVEAAQVTSSDPAEASAITKTVNLLTSLRNVIQDGLLQLPNVVYGATFAEYTYNEPKCKRDIKYVIDAYLKDIRYGGNYETWGVASKYWVGEIPQVDGSRLPEIETHEFIRFLINNYIITNTPYTNLQDPIVQNQYIDEDLTFESQVAGTGYTPTNAVYTPTTGQLVLTLGAHDFEIGDKIDIIENSLVFTCSLDNNATEHPYPRATGSSAPGGYDYAYAYPVEITATTNNSITVYVGISSDTSTHTFVRATNNAIRSANDGRTNTLYALLANIILNGLDARPERTSGLGYIRVQGRVREEDLLIITNVSVGEIIYTFNDPGKLALCEFLKDYEGADNDFPSFDQTTDTITNINLYADTSSHTTDDKLQIFVEDKEIRTRPFDFGTDAIERNRVANAQSMLDADFEYGLQPTKWQAIGMLRGYPSIYEIPGTEVPVESVTTDASTTTEGIGQSIITVACASPHDFSAGDPFTIKGLGGTALGIGRAEGSFVVYTIESPVEFTYFAKSKVGQSVGEVLSTTYTQLRKAGFYTGSPIGTPEFIVESNGTAGTLTTSLAVLAGNDSIPFSGDAPEIGAPLVDATGAIPSGAQVSAVNGSGGINTSKNLTTDAVTGQQTIDIDDTTDVTVGQAIDSGDGTAAFVTQIVGNTITLSDPLTADRVGSNVTYSGVAGNLISSTAGAGATFNVVRNAGNYDNVTVSNGGSDYSVNDALIILGSSVGGTDQLNNIFIQVTAVNAGAITAISFEGIAAPANGIFPGIQGQLQAGLGTGAVFDISGLNNVYTVNLSTLSFDNIIAPSGVFNGNSASFDISYQNNVYSTVINNPGIDYQAGDRLIITGDNFPNGASPDNDLIITVNSVGASGEILNTSLSGTAPDAQNAYVNPTYTYTGTGGSNAEFAVQTDGSSYTVGNIQNGGFGYNPGETFDITGDQLGGASPANDAQITIVTTDAGGGILTVSITGTALNYGEQLNNLANPFFGSGASFNVQKNSTSWSATIQSAGLNYIVGDQLIIDLSVYGIESPTYDINIEVTGTGSSGEITTIAVTGTSPEPGGEGYFVSDRIIIPGPDLPIPGTLTPDNDITIDVQTVGGNGEILTFTISGTAPDAANNFTNVNYSTAGNGINAQLDVSTNGTTYGATIPNGGSGFNIGDQLIVTGNLLGGATPGNDLIITVSDVDGSGSILDFGLSGTARNAFTYSNFAGTIQTGTGAAFTIENASTVYSVTVDTGGEGYIVGQEILVPGNTIGGITPTNDLTITIATVDPNGGIQTINFTGTGGTGSGTYTTVASDYAPLSGQLASFDINRTTTYDVTVFDAGSGYYVGNQILINGNSLGGTSPANDIIVTVTAVDDPYTGGITSVTATGTPTTSGQIDFYSTITFTEFTTQLLPAATDVEFRALATLRIDFSSNHGLVPGDTFIVTISSDDGITDGSGNNHKLAAGPYIATSVPTLSSLTYQARAAGSIDTVDNELEGIIYARPDSFFVHRPYDGGVQLGTGGPQHGAQAIRQSKNYIRYQSGKGIMYTTGALFAPSYDLLTATATGTTTGSTIEFEVDDSDHGLQVGGIIEILGILTPGYNGIYTVSDIVSERKFRVLATTTLGTTLPRLGPASQISTKEWHGATVRAGAFDEQNGIFWQYDGKNLAVTQRSSTFQLAGLGTIDSEDNTIYGLNCRFLDQCSAGDRIVIRGMTHVVSSVIDNNTMTVTPDYRGVRRAINAKLCLINDKTVKQRDFNLDPVDGTGKSGYDVDISKMQMIGIQYSWYGAGFIDYMLRGADGNFIFCHRMRNSNVNTEAFMRSGNLPVRYEVTNEGANGKLAEDIDDSQTTIPLIDASFFPDNGATIYIDNEIITYTAIEGNNLINCQRSATLTNYQAGAQRQYSAGSADSHIARTGVVIISSSITPIISHWGSAFITDGGFDEDRGYIFSYASAGIDITTTRATAFLLRLAPSVSNAITGDLGDRELLNRAQLLLNGVEVTSDPLGTGDTGGIIIEGILNPSNYPEAVNDVTWGSLSGLAEGGQPSFAQIAPGAGINWDVGAALTVDVATVSTSDTLNNITIVRADQGRNYFYVPSADEYDIGIGSVVTGTNGSGQSVFQSNTTVTSVQRNNTTSYDGSATVQVDRINISRQISRSVQWWRGLGSGSATINSVTGDGNITLPFPAAYIAAGVSQGTAVDTSEVAFPAGTSVTSVSTTTHNGSTYYFVTFNQPTSSSYSAGDIITFNLSGAAYAQPGETIFKFIAVPGERSELDLSPIKELTNTSLGGRGTFPNGPDVLAINVYKTSGSDIQGNIILKWGEAQA